MLLVTKTDDEWFMAKESFYKWHKGVQSYSYKKDYYSSVEGQLVYESHYKCDTVDGLIQLLKARKDWIDKFFLKRTNRL